MKKFIKNKKHGFTLVELLVVIAILAVLGSVTVVGYLGFTTRARNSNALTELAQARELIRSEYIDGNAHYYTVTSNSESEAEVKNATAASYNLSFTYKASEKAFNYATVTNTGTAFTVTWDALLKATFTELSDMGTFYVTVDTTTNDSKTTTTTKITSIAYKSKTEGYAVWTINSDEIATGSESSIKDATDNKVTLYTYSAA